MKKLLILFYFLIATFSFAQNQAERTKHYNLEKGLAIEGFDPVSYFTKGQAEKGNAKFAATYQGITYYFASTVNKDLFLKTPTKYEPQYGGWCAFAMGDYNKKVEINPETFKIIDGKLFLFYDAYFNNTLKSWNKDEKNLKISADKNWNIYLKK
jgi:YHS domain-containing protein